MLIWPDFVHQVEDIEIGLQHFRSCPPTLIFPWAGAIEPETGSASELEKLPAPVLNILEQAKSIPDPQGKPKALSTKDVGLKPRFPSAMTSICPHKSIIAKSGPLTPGYVVRSCQISLSVPEM